MLAVKSECNKKKERVQSTAVNEGPTLPDSHPNP